MNPQAGFVVAALMLYAGWTAATWFFEGRTLVLLRPDAMVDRIVYAIVANLSIGIGASFVLLRRNHRATGDPSQGGFGPLARSLKWTAIGAAAGIALYLIQGAPSTHPIVVLNAFSQVFVVSAAEVLVCWAVVGRAVEAATSRNRPIAAVLLAMVIASVLFGAYHVAHSPPFNSVRMVAVLSVVGLAAGAFFFASRDAMATIVFHNFLGTFGVVQALKSAGGLSTFERVQPPLVAMALITAAAVAGGSYWLRRSSTDPGAAGESLRREE